MTDAIDVRFSRAHPAARLPEHANGDVEADLFACLDRPLILMPGARGLVSTGLAAVLPDGVELQVRPRPSPALRKGLTVLNAPAGTEGAEGRILYVLLINHGDDAVTVHHDDAIARVIVTPVLRAVFGWVE